MIYINILNLHKYFSSTKLIFWSVSSSNFMFFSKTFFPYKCIMQDCGRDYQII